MMQDEAVWPAARPHRPERLVPGRRLAEIVLDYLRKITAPGGLVLGGERGRRRERGRIETIVGSWIVDERETVTPVRALSPCTSPPPRVRRL